MGEARRGGGATRAAVRTDGAVHPRLPMSRPCEEGDAGAGKEGVRMLCLSAGAWGDGRCCCDRFRTRR